MGCTNRHRCSIGFLVCAKLLLAFLALSRINAQTQLQDRVLVVYNGHARDSEEVADYYLLKRSIPENHLCKIEPSSLDEIKRDEFDSRVKPAIKKCLDLLGKDTILYIVFSYQTPFLLNMGPKTNALDQYVADIWDEFLPERTAGLSEVQPYFGGAQPQGEVYQSYLSLADYRHQANARRIYSVWRL